MKYITRKGRPLFRGDREIGTDAEIDKVRRKVIYSLKTTRNDGWKEGTEMARTWKIEGLLPAGCVVYKDKRCKELDEEAYRTLLRDILQTEINAFVVGGHAGETECLTMEERLKVIRWAKEEGKGKVPVVGGIVADATWKAIEQGKRQKDAGVDGFLFCPPNMVAWDPNTAEEILLEHVKHFDREVNMPMIMFGGPTSEGNYQILPKTFKRLAVEVENLAGWKITTRYDLGQFKRCLNALRDAEKVTGRHVAALNAGDHILVETIREGGDGSLNGGDVYRAKEDMEIYRAVKRGDLNHAYAVQDRLRPITDAIRGVMFGSSQTFFHYRYKVAAWLMGKIPRPHMRLPQLPISKQEVEFMRNALIQSGLKPVREAEAIEISET
jgi:4-hydroxy-tetrahydrodipicolinate synthase